VTSDATTSAAPALPALPHPAAADYCFGGAGDESTMARNEAVLDRYVLVPRMLRGTARPRLATEVAGGRIEAPLFVAPMGLQGLLHPDAEAATAAAAAAAGVGFCLSTFCSRTPDEVVSAAGPGLRWFQLYVLREPQLTEHLLDEAARLGFDAVVCTLDVPVVGRRRVVAGGFDRFAAAPPGLVRSAPFRELAARLGLPAEAVLDRVFPYPECTWADIAALIASTPLPVVLKGILHPDDARRAVDIGAAGVVVSNHGGRQFDRSITSVEALPGVLDAVGGARPVYLDSGVRTATHAAVALALGARAVLLGRPVLAALAEGGRDAVTAVLRSVVDDLAHVMTLVGATRPADLARADAVLARCAGDATGPCCGAAR
jgi:isopentenyl diphosphate isomerase/L-lactate dehydrogenase-like FMN-dependent dehydrogenase